MCDRDKHEYFVFERKSPPLVQGNIQSTGVELVLNDSQGFSNMHDFEKQ